MTLTRFLLGTLVLVASLSGQTTNAPADSVSTAVSRLALGRFKEHIKGLTQFGDRMQGTQRNRDAIDWLEKQLRSFGYTNVARQRFMSSSGPLENIYATKSGFDDARRDVHRLSTHGWPGRRRSRGR